MLHDAVAVRRVSAGELRRRPATHSAVVRAEPACAGARQHEEPAGVRLAHRRERRLSAQLCAHGVDRVGDRADHGWGIRDSRQPARRVPRSGGHRAERAAAATASHSRITIRRFSRTSSSTPGTGTAFGPSTSPTRTRRVRSATPSAVPHGIARTYPVFRDGLIYWVDNRTGLHVGRYTGPRADELPGPGTGVYEGNATSPHR